MTELYFHDVVNDVYFNKDSQISVTGSDEGTSFGVQVAIYWGSPLYRFVGTENFPYATREEAVLAMNDYVAKFAGVVGHPNED